ncbi:MAG: thioredoxin domain-containing protein, partial [Promethearchaeota archaeon]
YQTVVQLMGKRGGWPLSVFLTPDKKPIFGGTYFPPHSRFGIISFPDLLNQLVNVYNSDRQKVEQAGEEINNTILNVYNQGSKASQTQIDHFNPELFDEVLKEFLLGFDEQNGGYGSAPKFPNFPSLTMIMRQIKETDQNLEKPTSKKLISNVKLTLDKMARGGIYDQIGGGFHRYSVDKYWLVPHFEKMLYDNAMALVAYSEAYQFFNKTRYKEIVREIIEWIQRDMYVDTEKKGLYSTLDADSDGKEGKYYVWKKDELDKLLSDEEKEVFYSVFEITPKGNFEDHQIILHQVQELEEVGNKINKDLIKIKEILTRFKQKLLERRKLRVKPSLDNKIITAWNALTLHGLYSAYKIFVDEPFGEEILELATNISKFLRNTMFDSETGHLYRIYIENSSKISGNLNDYAYFIQALWDEFNITHEMALLKDIEKLLTYVHEHFWDGSGNTYYFSDVKEKDIITRPKLLFDAPLPNSNAVMAENLLQADYWFNESKYQDLAEKILKELFVKSKNSPLGNATYFISLQRFMYGSTDIVIILPQDQKLGPQFHKEVFSKYIPRLNFFQGKLPTDNDQFLSDLKIIQNKPTFYLCHEFKCFAPEIDQEKFLIELNKYF